MAVKYSVCIPNYNMADTLERALKSVLDQLDHNFEVLVIDDASTDGSQKILKQLELEYKFMRVIYLEKDRSRELGETRNISVREALGKYVLLHVDADDFWEPHIKDFIEVFHQIESCLGRDVLIAGQQLNMGLRSFLLRYGPYRNTQRAQDRDMWLRLAADGLYIPLEHKVFRKRLPRSKKYRLGITLRNAWYHTVYDLRRGIQKKKYVFNTIFGPFTSQNNSFSMKFKILRSFLIIPALIYSHYFCEQLPPPKNLQSHESFTDYVEKTRGSFAEIMSRYGASPDLSKLSSKGLDIFQ